MLTGHGDDLHNYSKIELNFSSNIYGGLNHEGLFRHLASKMSNMLSYPEPEPVSLHFALSHHLNIQPANVCATNGATEAIYLIAQTFKSKTSTILIPTFSEYADACTMHGHKIYFAKNLTEIPVNTDLVWICNPNNPTGTVTDRDILLAFITKHPDTLFVIDASYASFTLKPQVSPLEACRLPNLIMIHSMTKEYAVPGLRIGYITASAERIASIRQQRMPWSVNQMAIEAALYLLKHRDDYRLDLPALMSERERMQTELNGINGIQALPSDTHILLCRSHNITSAVLKLRLANHHGILIRDASNFVGLDLHYFRIAIQSPAQNNCLCQALKNSI